ncbi:DUF3102 domain-containing protein [Staphylococcus cohnii]|uniref:DUF3102 domain-containing protein n=1 Tax=Staphylococcus cohnii TaxID=29382 RepID=UPI000CD30E2F|nr:DUF3102 domain-containing protein [Staphylococcus cohnii]AYX89313.1 DUF3102 domain-containing protein [Staphylococcus cohnii]PNZ44652.1 hypothetical protein CD032_06690 [Staphylococcus cohnii subsp. cohnii]GEP86799.1 hypothetical protein SCO01_09890 [Staphylococcus cohnii subsp. cohnii]SUM09151.1 phage protein [Staphylococcus cohnii]
MNELQLSDDLTTIETEIKSYQNIAGQSIFEIGRRLKHVKENDLVHGEFGKWLENVGMHKQQAQRFIKIAEEFRSSNTTPVLHLGIKALYQLATMPEEQRNHVIENGIETENGNKSIDEATTRELEKYKKQLKQRDEEKSQLESQLEQAQRSESIARKQLEEAEDRDPEVIEKYMEPEDYQSIKNMNEHLQSEREYYKKQADDFRNEVRDIMNQPNETTEFTGKDDNKDYTPIFIHLLKPVEKFIDHYNHHINKENALNEIEKIKKILKEQ